MTVSGALRAHLIAFAQAVSSESGGELQALLGVAKGAALLEGVGTNANAAVAVVRSTRLLPEAWDRVVACNLCAAASLRAADHAAAFSLTHDALVALIECVPNTVGAWIVRPLLGVAFDADALTKPARAQALREGTREAHEKLLQSLAATYRNAFGSCYSDRTPAIASSRRTGCLSIANLCFKLFFKLNTPRQCSCVAREGEWGSSVHLAPSHDALTTSTPPHSAFLFPSLRPPRLCPSTRAPSPRAPS